jgi:hypothetical protein
MVRGARRAGDKNGPIPAGTRTTINISPSNDLFWCRYMRSNRLCHFVLFLRPLLFAVLVLSEAVVGLQAQDWTRPMSVRKDCGSGVEVTAEEVFRGMEPAIPDVPSSCGNSTRSLLKQFSDENHENWESLSNRACAAKLGWVENSPGICSAGGPPPICPRKDHWHKDSAAATYAWKQYQQDHYTQSRQMRLTEAACGCWMNLITASPAAQVLGRSANPFSYTPSFDVPAAVVPCSDTRECQVSEPGSVCTARNLCELPNAFQRNVKLSGELAANTTVGVTENIATEVAKRELLSALPSEIAGLITEITQKFAFRTGAAVVGGIFQAQQTETLVPSYKAALVQMSNGLSSLRLQYSQLNQLNSGKGPRAPYSRNELLAAIAQNKQQLRMDMNNANSFLAGIQQQRELRPGACYNVLEYQNSATMADAAKALSLPDQ